MTPPPRAADFLQGAGWAGAALEPLAGDASFRRYFRVRDGERTAVLMDSPPDREDPRPFLAMAGWLAERGFRPPAVLAADPAAGLVLLEDFGDDRMREAADGAPGDGGDQESGGEAGHGGQGGDREVHLYEAAVDLLVELHRHPAGPLAPYDAAELRREADLFPEWYCSAVALDVDRPAYAAAWDKALAHALPPAEPVTVLRDFHAENLMVTPRGLGAGLGLLDFQDALAGHPAYDLVSLLQDARRDVDPNLEERMIGRYRAATGAGDAFLNAYHVLGAQRNAKILGIFTRLWKRDGKDRYAALCPRVWAYLERDLSYPTLRPVAEWFDGQVPPERRGDPRLLA